MKEPGIYYRDADAWFQETVFKNQIWNFNIEQQSFNLKLGEIIAAKCSHPPGLWNRGEGMVTAVYKATIKPQSHHAEDRHVITKIFMQSVLYSSQADGPRTDSSRIPPIPCVTGKNYSCIDDLKALKAPIEVQGKKEQCEAARVEAENLAFLTKRRSTHSPDLISFFSRPDKNPWIKDGYLEFVIMERLSGVTVDTKWEYKPGSEEVREEQKRIQRAFRVAYLHISNLGVTQHDEAARNLIWNRSREKIYFIDFEGASIVENVKPQTWQDVLKIHWTSEHVYSDWGLAMKEDWNVIMKFREDREARHHDS